MTGQQEVTFKVGRRSVDGIVRVSTHPPQLVQLSVSYKGERAASVVLTKAQVRELVDILIQFEGRLAEEQSHTEVWNSDDRRGSTVISEPLTA